MGTMNMHIGLIGLGKMGERMRTRLREFVRAFQMRVFRTSLPAPLAPDCFY